MPSSEFHHGKSTLGYLASSELEHKSKTDLISGCYVNLPQHWTSSSIVTTASAPTATTNTCTNNVVSPQPASTTGSLTTRFKHLVQSFHHPNSNSSGGGSSSSHGGVFSGASFAHVHSTGLVDSRTSSKSVDSSGRQPGSRNKPWVNRTSLDATGNTTGVISTGSSSCVQPSSASVSGVLKQDLFAVPAEVSLEIAVSVTQAIFSFCLVLSPNTIIVIIVISDIPI